MIRTKLSIALALAVCALPGLTAAAHADEPPRMLGPGDAQVSGIKDEALIRTSKFGYVYIAGQQHSRLTVTYLADSNSLRYRDYGTKKLTKIPKTCTREKVRQGISVRCTVGDRFAKKMYVQVWPRLGNDHVDGHTLPARFRLWVLADAGADVVKCGVGDCFVNGAKGDDRIFGNTGDDRLSGGPGHNHIVGGGGDDRTS